MSFKFFNKLEGNDYKQMLKNIIDEDDEYEDDDKKNEGNYYVKKKTFGTKQKETDN